MSEAAIAGRIGPGNALDNLRAIAGIDIDGAFASYRSTNEAVVALKKLEAEILATLAAYRGRFWRDGTFNHERKALLASIQEARREALEENGDKVVEAALESYARASKSYREWLTEQARDRQEMHTLDARLVHTRARIEHAEGERELAKQRLRLNEEVLRFARAEAYVAR